MSDFNLSLSVAFPFQTFWFDLHQRLTDADGTASEVGRCRVNGVQIKLGLWHRPGEQLEGAESSFNTIDPPRKESFKAAALNTEQNRKWRRSAAAGHLSDAPHLLHSRGGGGGGGGTLGLYPLKGNSRLD